MTAEEWDCCTDCRRLLALLQGQASNRKLRLLAVAWCRCLGPLLADQRSREAVEVGERFADRLATEEERLAAREAAAQVVVEAVAEQRFEDAFVAWKARKTVELARDRLVPVEHWSIFPGDRELRALIGDVFGNPFRPLRRRTFPAPVVGLAQSCYEAFPSISADYHILADALDDLGEDRAAAHCREPLHVKGCHVVDWIMGKE